MNSFIETQFPVSRVSKESYKERMANYSQTLTGLGKWWGRKPLILVRATLLGLLMPTSNNPVRDREIFLKILTMDEDGLWERKNKPLSAKEVYNILTDEFHEGRVFIKIDNYSDVFPTFKEVSREAFLSRYITEKNGSYRWIKSLDKKEKLSLERFAFDCLYYDEKLNYCARPEQIEGPSKESWKEINKHLGTNANSIVELTQELGKKQFGSIPRVGDAFCGGGSIPFEAARMGCDVYASDLNPVAALLTWAALNIVGGGEEVATQVKEAQKEIYEAVDKQVTEWGIEHNEFFHRADAYLYCVEVEDPETGWKVPLAPSWVIGEKTKTVAILVPDEKNKRYEIQVKMDATPAEMKAAKQGTVVKGYVIHPKNPNRIPMDLVRRENKGGLRLWENDDIIPRPDDVFQERLYCIRYVVKSLSERIWDFCKFAKDTDFSIYKKIYLEPKKELLKKMATSLKVVSDNFLFSIDTEKIKELISDKSKEIAITTENLVLAFYTLESCKHFELREDGEEYLYFEKNVYGIVLQVKLSYGTDELALLDFTIQKAKPKEGSEDLITDKTPEEAIALLLESNAKSSDYRYYTTPTPEDIEREKKAYQLIKERFSDWQEKGYIPSKKIEPGDETSRLQREKGWTHWHQLFNPRQLLVNGLIMSCVNNFKKQEIVVLIQLIIGRATNWNSSLCIWDPHHTREKTAMTFLNQALNTMLNFPAASLLSLSTSINFPIGNEHSVFSSSCNVSVKSISDNTFYNNIWITDPPYADAVNYHELTEFFLAWYEKHLPKLFPDWYTDSKRALAIKGQGESFRISMVEAYSNLKNNMPDNGMQVVMFTHQDASVWADLALILWASGLKVTAAWTIATETTSALKEGNYVQGTVLLVLRKNTSEETAFLDELNQLIEDEVKIQIDSMHKVEDKEEPNFSDTDYQLAAYAASLRILTGYKKIEDIDVQRELSKTKKKGEVSELEKTIENAKKIAASYLIPTGIDKANWLDLSGEERFFLKGLDMEAKGENKLGAYQELARGYGLREYKDLLGSSHANQVKLKTPEEFGTSQLSGEGFAITSTRHCLYALLLTVKEESPRAGVNWLKVELENFSQKKTLVKAILEYLERFKYSLPHWEVYSEKATQVKAMIESELE